jgi:hypothetical protein
MRGGITDLGCGVATTLDSHLLFEPVSCESRRATEVMTRCVDMSVDRYADVGVSFDAVKSVSLDD